MDSSDITLIEGQVLGQRDFTVLKRLGEGGCGVVYNVSGKHNERWAMKVESTARKKTDQLLPLEAQVLKRLQFSPYAVRFIQYGKCKVDQQKEFRFLVMGLLGPSITYLQEEQPEYKFVIGTVLRIGLQAIRALAFLHYIYFVHRDVKPSNFAIDQANCRRIYLIDYGLARSMKKRGCMKLRKEREDVPFRGTASYCSLNVHKRKEQGRHDDIWSLMYMLIDLATGYLPWFKHSRTSTALLKEKLEDFEYLKGCPMAFTQILNYLRLLKYDQRPDYHALEKAFIQMMHLRDIKEDQPMCWEVNQKVQQEKRLNDTNKAQLESGGSNRDSGTWKAYTFSQDSGDDYAVLRI